MEERAAWHVNGFLALLLAVVSFVGAILSFVGSGNAAQGSGGTGWFVLLGILLLAVFIVILSSLSIVSPNEAKVITFFGKYEGTIRESGLWLVQPFTGKRKISLKVRNFLSDKLKVNDREGNPIEIAAVVVFKVADTAKAAFDVDDYVQFVRIQSESAIRHIAAQYPYDLFSEDERQWTLRGNGDEVAAELLSELQTRLNAAGVDILETRLTHLAYAQEIAGAMLQRQQAAAVVSARRKIVEGAVGMVEDALKQLETGGVTLDQERRAAMVNNLMVAIVSERAATPVINTGA